MSGLYERMHGIRLCVACRAHEAIADGDRCGPCLNELLRETRPEPVRQAIWLERARKQPNGLARDLTRGAA